MIAFPHMSRAERRNSSLRWAWTSCSAREGPYVWDVSGEKKAHQLPLQRRGLQPRPLEPGDGPGAQGKPRHLDIGNHHLVSEQRALLAERLAQLSPAKIDLHGLRRGRRRGGGSRHQARPGVHGQETRSSRPWADTTDIPGLALATGDDKYRDPFGPNPQGFVQVPFNDLPGLARELDSDTAAVIFETVPATLGMPIPDPDFYPGVKELCSSSGALLIVDEIQTGLGSTGRLWGIEHYGAESRHHGHGQGALRRDLPHERHLHHGRARVLLPRPALHPRLHLRRRRGGVPRGPGRARGILEAGIPGAREVALRGLRPRLRKAQGRSTPRSSWA